MATIRYSPLTHKNLGKIDHAVRGFRDADPGQLEITHDISPVPGTMEPAIHHFPRIHRTRCDILRRDMQFPQLSADQVDPLPEPIMTKRTFAGQHIPAVSQRNG
jgi:hypothetical protein